MPGRPRSGGREVSRAVGAVARMLRRDAGAHVRIGPAS